MSRYPFPSSFTDRHLPTKLAASNGCFSACDNSATKSTLATNTICVVSICFLLAPAFTRRHNVWDHRLAASDFDSDSARPAVPVHAIVIPTIVRAPVVAKGIIVSQVDPFCLHPCRICTIAERQIH